jgi:hypothetical protein
MRSTGRTRKCYKRHRQQEFLKFLKEIDAQVEREPGVQIHIIMDNYATHKTPTVKRWFSLSAHLGLNISDFHPPLVDGCHRPATLLPLGWTADRASREVKRRENGVRTISLAPGEGNVEGCTWRAGARYGFPKAEAGLPGTTYFISQGPSSIRDPVGAAE